MTIYGLDISNHQSRDGFNVAASVAEGFAFLTHKMSEGTWKDPFFRAVALEAHRHYPGRWGGYVFCRTNITPAAEADVVVEVARAAGFAPGDFALQIDYEDTTNGGSGIDLFARVREHQARGWHLLPVYLPRWFWLGRMGSPDLSGLPVGLWNSDYVAGAGYAASLYPGDGYKGWTSFGGKKVDILQYSERGIAAGENPLDLNAFRGSPAELDALFGGSGMSDEKADAILVQEAGPGATPTRFPGWPLWRYHEASRPEKDRTKATQTDILRGLDAKMCSELPAADDPKNPRPKALETPDDLFGHVLSLRAQVAQLSDMLVAKAQIEGDADLLEAYDDVREGRR